MSSMSEKDKAGMALVLFSVIAIGVTALAMHWAPIGWGLMILFVAVAAADGYGRRVHTPLSRLPQAGRSKRMAAALSLAFISMCTTAGPGAIFRAEKAHKLQAQEQVAKEAPARAREATRKEEEHLRVVLAPLLDPKVSLSDRARAATDALARIDARPSGPTRFDALHATLLPVRDAAKELVAAEDRIAAAKATPEPPKKPVYERPVYEKPEYTGARRISGHFRGNYKGGGMLGIGEKEGIVIQTGSKYILIVGAERSAAGAFLGTSEVSGYATPSEETVTVDIGRNGREAEVWEYAADETYKDDQHDYRQQLTDSRRTYEEAVTTSKHEYERALATYEESVAKYDAEAAQRAKTMDEDTAKLPSLRDRLSSAVDSAAGAAAPVIITSSRQ